MRTANLGLQHLLFQLTAHLGNDVVLQRKKVGGTLVEPLTPDVVAARGVDQLNIDPHPSLVALDRAFKRVTLCGLYIHTKRATQGVGECERVLTVDPSDFAVVQEEIGRAMMYLGRAEDAENRVTEGLRVNPSDIGVPYFYVTAGEAALVLGEDEKAVRWLRGAIERNANQPLAHFYLAAALARLDQMDEARAEMQAGLALDPKFSITRATVYRESDNPTYLAQRDRLIEALRKAGAPER